MSLNTKCHVYFCFKFIKNLHKEDAVLMTVPAFEKAVSRVLRDIRVVRRLVSKFKHFGGGGELIKLEIVNSTLIFT